MIQEDKVLLFKDLSARLPYGIKFPMICWDEETGEAVRPVTLYSIDKDGYCHVSEEDYSPYIDEIKPYLFPMSSITEEQEREIVSITYSNHNDMVIASLTIDWLNKHHIDYRGLIPMGLANDATGLNIY